MCLHCELFKVFTDAMLRDGMPVCEAASHLGAMIGSFINIEDEDKRAELTRDFIADMMKGMALTLRGVEISHHAVDDFPTTQGNAQ